VMGSMQFLTGYTEAFCQIRQEQHEGDWRGERRFVEIGAQSLAWCSRAQTSSGLHHSRNKTCVGGCEPYSLQFSIISRFGQDLVKHCEYKS
jgi:hypothetical protein